jgi:hypothetical protein
MKRLPRLLKKSIQKIKRSNNTIDLSKEEIILHKLEASLGKPKEEISQLFTKDLMALLTLVPFRNL